MYTVQNIVEKFGFTEKSYDPKLLAQTVKTTCSDPLLLETMLNLQHTYEEEQAAHYMKVAVMQK